MSKPEFSRPFDIISAKAGAPYCCRDGEPATVLKWDGRRFNEPLVGCIGADDVPASWGSDGRYVPDEHGQRPRDLVMLPVGMCQSKPVFVGDELLTRFGDKFVVEKKHIGDLDEENTWPVATSDYPKTQMTEGAMRSVAIDAIGGATLSCEAVANAAIRHGIDNGYLLDPRDLQQGMSIKASPEDVQRIMSGDTGRASIQCVPTNEPMRSAERDMAIAEAAAQAVYKKVYQFGSHRVAYCDLRLDLPAIIASVTGAKDAKEGAA